MTRLNPQWAPLRHVVRIVDKGGRSRRTNVFVISSQPSAIGGGRPLHGQARASGSCHHSATTLSSVLAKLQFHLCLASSRIPIQEFPKIVAMAPACSRAARSSASTDPSLTPLPGNGPNLAAALSGLIGPMRVHYGGSIQSVKVLDAFQRASAGAGSRWGAARLGFARCALLHKRWPPIRRNPQYAEGDLNPPVLCTSIIRSHRPTICKLATSTPLKRCTRRSARQAFMVTIYSPRLLRSAG